MPACVQRVMDAVEFWRGDFVFAIFFQRANVFVTGIRFFGFHAAQGCGILEVTYRRILQVRVDESSSDGERMARIGLFIGHVDVIIV